MHALLLPLGCACACMPCCNPFPVVCLAVLWLDCWCQHHVGVPAGRQYCGQGLLVLLHNIDRWALQEPVSALLDTIWASMLCGFPAPTQSKVCTVAVISKTLGRPMHCASYSRAWLGHVLRQQPVGEAVQGCHVVRAAFAVALRKVICRGTTKLQYNLYCSKQGHGPSACTASYLCTTGGV